METARPTDDAISSDHGMSGEAAGCNDQHVATAVERAAGVRVITTRLISPDGLMWPVEGHDHG